MNDKVTTVDAQAAERPPLSAKGGKADEIASRIEADINAGLLATGSWLKQINLEKRYGCSRIDVRQALESLTARRLVHR
ncbi:MAG: GntR family transcriptional regulator, partial [Pseudomonadota bacterium]